jgi:hypothetical protein
MSHTPYGYRIENGNAVLDIVAAEKIKALFLAYLSGDSLATAAQKAGILTSMRLSEKCSGISITSVMITTRQL